MARTPFFDAVRRAVRLAAVANRAGVPPDRGVDQDEARRRFGRRALLAGAAGLTVLPACAGVRGVAPLPRPAAPVSEPLRAPSLPAAAGRDDVVAVVGAGTAGLLCAYRLRQAGIDVRVYEAATRVGGRMFSDRDTFAPLVCELGGELIDSGHERMHALVRELGLTLDDLRAASAGLAATYHFGGHDLSEAEVVAILRPAARAIAADAQSIDGAKSPFHQIGGAFRELDAWSVDRWLKERRISGVAADMIRVAFMTEMGLPPDELSCIPVLQMLQIGDGRLEWYGESDERFHVRGGNDQIPSLLASRLGEVVVRDHALVAMRALPDGRIELDFREDRTIRTARAQRVVLALPFSRLRDVDVDASVGLSPLKQRAIRELAYGTNAKLMLGFSSRPWRAKKRDGAIFTDLALQNAWEGSRAQAGDAGVLTIFKGGDEGLRLGERAAAWQAARALADVAKVWPGAEGAATGKAVRFHWPSAEHVRGSYSTWKVGQMSTFGGVEPVAEGPVHFAGEHTSAEAQGFMEGAVESGERAAREVLAAIGAGAVARAVP